MISDYQRVRELETGFDRARYSGMSLEERFRRYEAMWEWARQHAPDPASRWREDIEADIELARVLNHGIHHG